MRFAPLDEQDILRRLLTLPLSAFSKVQALRDDNTRLADEYTRGQQENATLRQALEGIQRRVAALETASALTTRESCDPALASQRGLPEAVGDPFTQEEVAIGEPTSGTRALSPHGEHADAYLVFLTGVEACSSATSTFVK